MQKNALPKQNANVFFPTAAGIRNPLRYLLMKNEPQFAAHFSNCPEHFL